MALAALLAVSLACCGGSVRSPAFSKLTGAGASGAAGQGTSVALSANAATAIVGGASDDADAGAAWVFRRKGGVWRQQGHKLVGSGASGTAEQGASVALSADGNTALVGGPIDDRGAGAAWVFRRTGGVWRQQGQKLVGSGARASQQGFSVALSADGDTALIGGPGDHNAVGAAWVFRRTGGVWRQQGQKLVGSGASAIAHPSAILYQGHSVALSGAGSRALIGGPGDLDDGDAGAAWVFRRLGGVWRQQSEKLVSCPGAVGDGYSVSLSADGSTALIGNPLENGGVGAVAVLALSSRSCLRLRQPAEHPAPAAERPVLRGDGLGSIGFGQPPAVVTARLTRLFGPPVGSNEVPNGYVPSVCGVDHQTDWIGLYLKPNGDRFAAALSLYFRRSRFVGYGYTVYPRIAEAPGPPSNPAAPRLMLSTPRGLRVGDPLARGRQLYRQAFTLTTRTQGTPPNPRLPRYRVWQAFTTDGGISGAIDQPSAGRSSAEPRIGSINAGAGPNTPC